MYKIILVMILFISILFSIFLICTDNVAPFTTQASLQQKVSLVSPEVSGVIDEVLVNNGQRIYKGQPLFTLDKTQYNLNLKESHAVLSQAIEGYNAKKAELFATRNELKSAQAQLKIATSNYHRYLELIKKNLIRQTDVDDAWANVEAKKAFVTTVEGKILSLEIRVNIQHKTNAEVQLSQALVDKANWALDKTIVRADIDGIVTNLTLETGTFVHAGSQAMSIVSNNTGWLNADFTEKGMEHLSKGNTVLVSFDAFPGQVFDGTITSQDKAIQSHYNSTGVLSQVTNDSRWIREQQKIRTRISINDFPADLFSGSRASVIALNGNPVVDAMSRSWIHLVSLFRYIY